MEVTMFGSGSKGFPVKFVQEIVYRGDGPFHFEASAFLNTRPVELPILPFPIMAVGGFVGSTHTDDDAFHPVKYFGWNKTDRAYVAYCYPMNVSVGSMYELKIHLEERINLIYRDRSSEILEYTKKLLNRVKDARSEDRIFHHFTTEWPYKNQHNLIVYQNIRLATPDNKEGQHFQFRREWFLENVPQLGAEYTNKAASTGHLISLSQDALKGLWIAFSSPENEEDFLKTGANSFMLNCESEDERDKFLTQQFRSGWYCSKVPPETIRKLVGNPELGDMR